MPVLVKHSLSAVLPTFGTNPHERWTRTSSSTEEKKSVEFLYFRWISGQVEENPDFALIWPGVWYWRRFNRFNGSGCQVFWLKKNFFLTCLHYFPKVEVVLRCFWIIKKTTFFFSPVWTVFLQKASKPSIPSTCVNFRRSCQTISVDQTFKESQKKYFHLWKPKKRFIWDKTPKLVESPRRFWEICDFWGKYSKSSRQQMD